MVDSEVLVDLNGKPKCEVVCPFPGCQNISKLSSIAQVNQSDTPKFNTYNFERHYKQQHLNKKRSALDDITNLHNTKTQKQSEPGSSSASLNSTGENSVHNETQNNTASANRICQLEAKIDQLENENSQLRELNMKHNETQTNDASTSQMCQFEAKINQLEAENSELRQSNLSNGLRENELMQLKEKVLSQNVKISQLEKENVDLNHKLTDIVNLEEENINMRHIIMDMRGTVRVVSRIKPSVSQDCFEWERSKDGRILTIGKSCKENKFK